MATDGCDANDDYSSAVHPRPVDAARKACYRDTVQGRLQEEIPHWYQKTRAGPGGAKAALAAGMRALHSDARYSDSNTRRYPCGSGGGKRTQVAKKKVAGQAGDELKGARYTAPMFELRKWADDEPHRRFEAKVREFLVGDRNVLDDGACYAAERGVAIPYIEQKLPDLDPSAMLARSNADLQAQATMLGLKYTTGSTKRQLVQDIRQLYVAVSPPYTYVCTQLTAEGKLVAAATLYRQPQSSCLHIQLICARGGSGYGTALLDNITRFAIEHKYGGVNLLAANVFVYKYYARYGFRVSEDAGNLARQLWDFLPPPDTAKFMDKSRFRKVAQLLIDEQRDNRYADWALFERRVLRNLKMVDGVGFQEGIPMTLRLEGPFLQPRVLRLQRRRQRTKRA